MDLIHRSCCGLDVHQAVVVANVTVRISPKKKELELRSFSTVAAGLKEMAQWIQSKKCTCVAMEGTGVYWMPVYEALEGLVDEVVVANARHIKNVPGRKTDVADATWICDLARYGLLKPGFVPPKEIREVRELTRHRQRQVQSAATERNRLIKVLERHGVKLSTFLSDVFGVSGREMIVALIEGKSSPSEMAGVARGNLKRKVADIQRALEAPLNDSARFVLRGQYEHLLSIEKRIGELDKRIGSLLKPYEKERQGLESIVGIGAVSSAAILGEVGADLSSFPNQRAFSSWCGVSPGNNMSAGKRKNCPTNLGNCFMRSLLVECGWAAIKSPGYLQEKYYKLKARRGAKRAVVAIAHKLAIAVYHVLVEKTEYRELSPENLQRAERQQEAKLARKLKARGYTVLSPESAAAALPDAKPESAAAVLPDVKPESDVKPEITTPKRSTYNKRKALRG